MANTPLMPKATAVWLVDNTALSFTQIATFCKLHPLEVKAIADGEAAQGIKGLDPILTGQLTREEVEKAQEDPKYQLKLQGSKVVVPESKRKGPRYTPVSRRQDRPNAILWLVRNHPEMKDAQIMRLVGTTKPTIAAIRDRTHWNSANLTPSDPVTLGLCSQLELDMEVEKAAKNAPQTVAAEPVATLMPVEDSTSEDAIAAAFSLDPSQPVRREEEEEIDADAVFAKLNSLKGDDDPEASEVEASEAEASEAETPEAETPEAETPEAETSEAGTPVEEETK
ncbi:MAG: cell cycle transcriptional regulator TrcR [Pseudomonadota bacterium]